MTVRNFSIDHIKALACLSIVLHHLAFYGPMADVLQPIAPALVNGLIEYGRMAVQVFLVLGGYLSACSLAPQGQARAIQWWTPISQRFVRLSLPYSAALMVALVVNETVGALGFTHYSVSATPTWDAVLAHLLLLQSIGGWESISAGVWYVSIDFQLYALCAVWLWLSTQQKRCAWLGQAGVVAGTAASLWLWNLDSDLDIWALYFLGAYGLGMMAWWATHAPQRSQRALWVVLIAVLGGIALSVAWRERIALSLVMALVLAIGGNVRWPAQWQAWECKPLTWIGKRSYSIFLIHFPMCLLVSAEIYGSWPHSVIANALGIVLALALSLASGTVLYEWTEHPKATWQRLHGWYLAVVSTGFLATLTQAF